MLWISVGDGEAAPSDDLAAWGNARDAQELDNLYGKILRIDPEPSGGESYTVPEDNPFVDAPDARSEIWAYGLRNPWRFTFDRETGDLWIGDVGQFCWEEIDLAPASSGAGAGDNFGWPAVEGRARVPDGGARSHRVAGLRDLQRTRRSWHPGLFGCGRLPLPGDGIPQLQGGYVYGDSCRPELFALFPDGDGGWVRRSLRIDLRFVVGFGEDPRGELYVVSLFDGVHRLDFGENDGQYLDVGGESGDEPTRPTPDG
ncbi:MAG: PQQ-dependent sugar dehydrogenase [Acidimicrobiia bacterium]|nr:PQQ-dependent sugar dehydrogenase [Acidimicrobiia bacterium]